MLLVHTHINQPVMQVLTIRMERMLPFCKSSQNRPQRIDNRQPHHEEWNTKGYHRIDLKEALYRNNGQHKPQKHRARIPHEYLCRIQVIRQKAKARACKYSRNHRYRWISRRKQRHGKERKRGNRRDAACKSIKAVDQVDCIGNAHNPDNRDRYRPISKKDNLVKPCNLFDYNA